MCKSNLPIITSPGMPAPTPATRVRDSGEEARRQVREDEQELRLEIENRLREIIPLAAVGDAKHETACWYPLDGGSA